MALHIKFTGFDGESKEKEHKGWIDLESFSWGLSKAGEGATGQRGRVTVHDISCVKEVDKSTPKLCEAVLTGKVFPKVEIHDTATYGEARATFFKIELTNASVIKHAMSASGSASGSDAAAPTDSFSLDFSEVKQTYIEYDAKGTKKGNVEMTWKVEEGTK